MQDLRLWKWRSWRCLLWKWRSWRCLLWYDVMEFGKSYHCFGGVCFFIFRVVRKWRHQASLNCQ